MSNFTAVEWHFYQDPFIYQRTCSNLPLPGDLDLYPFDRFWLSKENQTIVGVAIVVIALGIGVVFYQKYRKR
jgi:hypothetical protein